MAATASLADESAATYEARLARRAVDGDGEAFARLYERYESRAFNLCYRLTASYDDAADATQEAFVSVLARLPKLGGRDLAFGSYLFTAARHACYDLIEKRKRVEPGEQLPETPTPAGGAASAGRPPEEDPDRKPLLEAQQQEIRQANATLPPRQREVLALRELEDLSYDEIAELMDMNRNSVAQLISRARLNLRDALRGTAMAAITGASPDCEHAAPLISAREDGQLDPLAGDAAWLDEHLSSCETCRLSQEAMQEAGASYRAFAPVAAAPWLFRETMAHAAERVGADWSDVVERRRSRPRERYRRDVVIAVGLAMALLFVVLVSPADDGPAPADHAVPVEDVAPNQKGGQEDEGKRRVLGRRSSGASSRASEAAAEKRSVKGGTSTGQTGAATPGAGRRETRKRQARGKPAPRANPAPVPLVPPSSAVVPAPPASSEAPPSEAPPERPSGCYDQRGNPVPCRRR